MKKFKLPVQSKRTEINSRNVRSVRTCNVLCARNSHSFQSILFFSKKCHIVGVKQV